MSDDKIPYKTYLAEAEVPAAWYNLRADMKKKPAPLVVPVLRPSMPLTVPFTRRRFVDLKVRPPNSKLLSEEYLSTPG